MTDSCNSRHFSCLMKSCFPNTQHPHHPHPSTTTRSVAATITTISSLPDDLLLECLSRVSHSSLHSLPFVCRRWAYLLNSSTFHHLRRQHNLLRLTLFTISASGNSTIFTATSDVWSDSTAPWKVSCFTVPSDGSFQSSFSHFRLVSIGRKIYVIGRTEMLRYDTWTGKLVSKAGMIFPRKKFAAAVVAGKIYVCGGGGAAPTVEEYDPDCNSWRVVSHATRKRYGCVGVALDGVFYVIGGLKIGSGCASDTRAAGVHAYASSMDMYDVEAGGWLRSRAVPGGGCVVAACAAGGDLYVLTSHAVELSFWRFSGLRKKCDGSGGYGEWCRIKSPPMPAQVRLDSTVRFSCVGVGEEKVVLIQVMGCIDDLLRRSGRSERGLREGLVLVYDCLTGEWSRGPDLPEVIRRAACVCVEC